jgi:methanogenic corrinoid protein MtbC1
MDFFYDEFINFLRKEDKDGCVTYVRDALEKSKIDIPVLYEQFFLPAVNGFECPLLDRQKCIWMQQVQSAIIRTLIECCYPYVLAQRQKNETPKSVAVICPEGEYDEISARMISDYFTFLGNRSLFVGANTKQEDFASVVKYISPDILVVSVTNPYHIVSAKNAITRVLTSFKHPIDIYVSGAAFENNGATVLSMGAKGHISNYHDIQNIMSGGAADETCK